MLLSHDQVWIFISHDNRWLYNGMMVTSVCNNGLGSDVYVLIDRCSQAQKKSMAFDLVSLIQSCRKRRKDIKRNSTDCMFQWAYYIQVEGNINVFICLSYLVNNSQTGTLMARFQGYELKYTENVFIILLLTN